MSISSYEEIPYATFALRPSYLGRLAALAHLYGVDVAEPHKCSVLEIGCGTGGNIVALADQYPESTFVGIDLAESHIAACKTLATGCGVTNVEFRCGDIRELQVENGRFDYIICHGLYSWVASDVRRALLEKISASLSPLGVAYVSYNVLPGWRQRGAVRDVMRTGAARCGVNAAPRERLAAGIEFLNLVAKVRSEESDLYGSYLREAIKRFQEADESYIFHEFLEEYNEPVLFSDFMEQASGVNLQFLSEAKPSLMSSDDLGPEVVRYIEGAEGDVIDREQRLDMVRNRMFRETILSHSSLALKRDLKASVFKRLTVVTDYRYERDLSEQETIFRELVSGREVTTPHDEHARVLALVGAAGYRGLLFNEVIDALHASAPTIDERALMHIIVRLWRAGFVELMTHPIPTTCVRQGSARVSRFALCQARQNAPLVASLQHRSFKISESERSVLKLSDGSRSFAEVAQAASLECDVREVDAAIERLLSLGFYLA